MKRIGFIIGFLLSLMASDLWSASKLSPQEYHFVSAWGSIGGAGLMNNSSDVKWQVGFSPALGVGYRYYHTGFILQIGVEGQYAYYRNTIGEDVSMSLKMIDTEGDPFDLGVSMRHYRDVTQVMNVNIPVMLGYEYHRFYFMAGASVGVNVWNEAKANSLIDTKASYSAFINPFESMPNHQLSNNTVGESRSYGVKWSVPAVNLHAEVGGRVDRFYLASGADVPKHNYRVYLAVFADYGLTNVNTNKNSNKLFDYRQSAGEPLVFDVLPVMKSNLMNDVKVNPLIAGVKVTVLWQLPGKSICVLCKD